MPQKNKCVTSIISNQVHDLLEEAELEPLSCESLANSDNIIENIDEIGRSDRNLIELKKILSSPFFRVRHS